MASEPVVSLTRGSRVLRPEAPRRRTRRPPTVTNDAGEAERDWFAWHRAYDDPGSDLRGRLGAVQGFIAEALTRQPPGRIRVVSVCAGQARDLLGVLATTGGDRTWRGGW